MYFPDKNGIMYADEFTWNKLLSESKYNNIYNKFVSGTIFNK